MNTRPNKRQHIWKILAVLLFVFCLVSASGTTDTSASKLASTSVTESSTDPVRQHMLDIAYLYANHRWQATATNIIHPDGINTDANAYVYTDDNPELGNLKEQDHITVKHVNGEGVLFRKDMFPLVDTPAWISTEEGVYNWGVPYAWGLSSGVIATAYDQQIDPNIKPVFIPMVENRSFDADITNGYFAGNQNIDKINGGNWWAAGVDCIGLINNAWGIDGRYPMVPTKDDYARPILFKDLKPGDILMRDGDIPEHVMLFENFENYNPATDGEPVPGFTMFKVFQASSIAGKVIESTYTLGVDSQLNVSVDWKRSGESEPSSKVKIGNEVYIPRTYFTPIDVILVIDASGSMTGSKMLQAQTAAKMFVDLMQPGDKIGVVAFSDTAQQPIYGLHEIGPNDNDAAKEGAKTFIGNIVTQDLTSIGAGLYAGLSEYAYNAPTTDPTKLIILLSDGGENADPTYASISVNFKNLGVKAYTVGLADNDHRGALDPEILLKIARENGGKYVHVSSADKLKIFFDLVYSDIYGEKVVKEVSGGVSQGETAENKIFVDSAAGSMTISLIWPDNDLDLTLVSPDGTVIDPSTAETDPNITFVSGPTYEFYKIRYSQTGEWTVNVHGTTTAAAGEQYAVSVSTMDAMTLSVNLDKDKYYIDEPVKVTASIAGGVIVPEYIHGATMQVTVENLDLGQSTFVLYDDGLHDDGGVDDGIYANRFENTQFEGSYNINVKVTGANNSFTREEQISTVVVAPPTVLSSVRALPNPTSLFTVDFTVTFSDPVTGVDTSDFVLTTTGLSGAFIKSISGSYGVYTVSVVPGSGTGTLRLDVVDDDTIIDQYGNLLGRPGEGNGNFTSGESYDVDRAVVNHPTVMSSVRASANPTSSSPVDFTVTFSEPVTGVDINDFVLTTSGLSWAFVRSVSGSGNVYTVSVVSGSRAGTLRLDVVDDDTIVDNVGNPLGDLGQRNGNFVTGETYIINRASHSFIVNKPSDTNDGTCDTDCSLREAIAAAGSGDVITFDAGLSGDTIHLNLALGQLTLSRDITIDGSMLPAPLIISGDSSGYPTGVDYVFWVNSGTFAVLKNLTITESKYSGIDNRGTLAIINVTLTGNRLSGGIYNYAGTLMVRNSTFSDNSSTYGGGIYNRGGTLIVTNSTFLDNHVTYDGGGIYSYDGGTITVTNSTFANNQRSIYFNRHGILTLINNTFSGDESSSEIYVASADGTLNFANNIIANSSAIENCINSGTMGINTNNLIQDGSCFASFNGDPKLETLANNGGPTQTMALSSSSPAIGMGGKAICANAPVNNMDQRGIARLQDGQCDIGAYEYVNFTALPTVDTFTATSSSISLNIQITDFTASDDVGVTGYMITESAIPPLAGDAGWLTTAPTVYTVSMDGNYALYPWVKDSDENVSSAFSSSSVIVDTIAPTVVSITRASTNPTNAATVQYSVTFSEAVTGVDVNDFTLTTTGVSGATVTSVSGPDTHNTYIVTVNTGTGDGTIRLDVLNATATITDLASNELARWFTDGEIYTVTKSTSTSH